MWLYIICTVNGVVLWDLLLSNILLFVQYFAALIDLCQSGKTNEIKKLFKLNDSPCPCSKSKIEELN